jgi:hypothetical protein
VIALTHAMIATRLDRQKLFFGPRAPFCQRTHLDPADGDAARLSGAARHAVALIMTWDVRKTLNALAAYNVQNVIDGKPRGLKQQTDR